MAYTASLHVYMYTGPRLKISCHYAKQLCSRMIYSYDLCMYIIAVTYYYTCIIHTYIQAIQTIIHAVAILIILLLLDLLTHASYSYSFHDHNAMELLSSGSNVPL